jgi:hypothetical protein
MEQLQSILTDLDNKAITKHQAYDLILVLFDVSNSLPDKAKALLKVAKCPNCDGSGTVVYNCDANGEIGDIGPCQWCYEKDEMLGNDC